MLEDGEAGEAMAVEGGVSEVVEVLSGVLSEEAEEADMGVGGEGCRNELSKVFLARRYDIIPQESRLMCGSLGLGYPIFTNPQRVDFLPPRLPRSARHRLETGSLAPRLSLAAAAFASDHLNALS